MSNELFIVAGNVQEFNRCKYRYSRLYPVVRYVRTHRDLRGRGNYDILFLPSSHALSDEIQDGILYLARASDATIVSESDLERRLRRLRIAWRRQNVI